MAKCKYCKKESAVWKCRQLCRSCYRELKAAGELDRYPVKHNVKRLIERLDDRYGEGFWMTIGTETLQATADRFDLSRERIRQIKNILNGKQGG